jgi:hypothetical protein
MLGEYQKYFQILPRYLYLNLLNHWIIACVIAKRWKRVQGKNLKCWNPGEIKPFYLGQVLKVYTMPHIFSLLLPLQLL